MCPGNPGTLRHFPGLESPGKRSLVLVSSGNLLKKGSLHSGQVAHQAGAYPGFCSMKRLGVFLLPPGWDASPSQGYPQHRWYPFIHLGGERH